MKKACKCCCLLFLCQCYNRAKPLYGTNVVLRLLSPILVNITSQMSI